MSYLPLILCFVVSLLGVSNSHAISIDFHLHAFSGSSWGKRITGDEIIAKLDEVKIDRGVVISAGYFGGFLSMIFGRSYEKTQLENDYVAEIVRAHPGRLDGACGVHPFDDWAERELRRCAYKLGFKAVKVHANAQRIDMLDEKERARLRGFVRQAGSLGMIVLVHAYGRSLDFNRELYRIAVENSETTFVFLHAFGKHFIALVDEMDRKKLKRAPNAWVDVSGTILNLEDPRPFVHSLRKFGLEHVLFGSDFPVYTPRDTLEAFKKLPLSADEAEQILSNNIDQDG